MKSFSDAYRNAGVDITAGYKSVELIKQHIKRTRNANVLSDIGGFGGIFNLDIETMKEPTLVSGTDGVGTKLKLAFLLDKHDTVGIDCVAMCVNDIICTGAKPLFFLDYIATGKLEPEKIASIVKGIADGCEMSGAALIGGETAEMPGFYPENEYDLAGFSVGIADRSKMITGSAMQAGDRIIALPSSGVHSNGFSLIRKIFDPEHWDLNTPIEELGDSLGETLITPTRIYVKPVLSLIGSNEVEVKGISHITGGGFYENIPRCIPKNKGLSAMVKEETLRIPPIFKLIEREGTINRRDMFNTFNMGVGMVLVVSKEDEKRSIELLEETGESPFVIGEIVDNRDFGRTFEDEPELTVLYDDLL